MERVHSETLKYQYSTKITTNIFAAGACQSSFFKMLTVYNLQHIMRHQITENIFSSQILFFFSCWQVDLFTCPLGDVMCDEMHHGWSTCHSLQLWDVLIHDAVSHPNLAF